MKKYEFLADYFEKKLLAIRTDINNECRKKDKQLTNDYDSVQQLAFIADEIDDIANEFRSVVVNEVKSGYPSIDLFNEQ